MSSGRMHRIDRLLVGSGLGLATGIFWTLRMQRNASSLARASVYSLAGKALLLGTLISASSMGFAVGMLARYLDVASFREFGVVVKAYMEGIVPSPITDAEAEQILRARLSK